MEKSFSNPNRQTAFYSPLKPLAIYFARRSLLSMVLPLLIRPLLCNWRVVLVLSIDRPPDDGVSEPTKKKADGRAAKLVSALANTSAGRLSRTNFSNVSGLDIRSLASATTSSGSFCSFYQKSGASTDFRTSSGFFKLRQPARLRLLPD